MTTSLFDIALTTDSPATRQAYTDYARGFLSYGPTLPRIIEAADNDPDCPSAQAHAAAVHMAFEAESSFQKARPYLERAKALARRASPREKTFIRAVEAWSRRDYRAVIEAIGAIAAQWPEDAVAIKWGQYHCFNLGDQEGLLSLARRLVEVYPGAPYVHGMEAFGLEQAHRLDEAEEAGRRAVAIEREDPWAHHAVAHVMETQGRVEEGLDWMLSLAPTWDKKGFFIRLHNWWHVALFHLDQEQPDAALAIYDQRLWDQYPGFSQELVGAVSALWRLELRGVDVGERWEPVVELVRARPAEHILPFLDLHYVYALARGGCGPEVDALLRSMASFSETCPDPALQCTWQTVALPAAQGLAAHASGRTQAAVEALAPVIPRLAAIGGSHAQRDVFVQTYIHALLGSGAEKAARPLIEERHRARPGIEVNRRLLSMVA